MGRTTGIQFHVEAIGTCHGIVDIATSSGHFGGHFAMHAMPLVGRSHDPDKPQVQWLLAAAGAIGMVESKGKFGCGRVFRRTDGFYPSIYNCIRFERAACIDHAMRNFEPDFLAEF